MAQRPRSSQPASLVRKPRFLMAGNS
jgi:hypothetical protein